MLVLSTNHLPKVGSTDQGTWRRILVLPFEATIQPHEMITDFHSLLIEREGGGILRWAVEGAMKFYEMGCTINHRPAAVVRASAEYRSSEDWLAAFIDECCHKGEPHDETMVVRHSDLYRVYHGWAKSNGEYVRSSTALSKALVSAGWHTKPKWFDADRNTTAKVWFGLTLQDGGRTFTLIKGTANERKAQ
jgi:phage/plasmid-associated DNA primase